MASACAARMLLRPRQALAAAPGPLWHHAMRDGLAGAALAALVAPAVFAALAWEKRLLGLT